MSGPRVFGWVFGGAAVAVAVVTAVALWAGEQAAEAQALVALGQQADALVAAYDGSATGVMRLQAEAEAQEDFLFLPTDDRAQRDEILSLGTDEGTATVVQRDVIFVVRDTPDGPLVLARPIAGMPSSWSRFRDRVLLGAAVASFLAALVGLVAARGPRREEGPTA